MQVLQLNFWLHLGAIRINWNMSRYRYMKKRKPVCWNGEMSISTPAFILPFPTLFTLYRPTHRNIILKLAVFLIYCSVSKLITIRENDHTKCSSNTQKKVQYFNRMICLFYNSTSSSWILKYTHNRNQQQKLKQKNYYCII